MLDRSIAMFKRLASMLLGLVVVSCFVMDRRGMMVLGGFVMTLGGVHVVL